MGILTREQILKAHDVSTETVPVPEWGGDVLVRGMTGAERDRFDQSVTDRNGKESKINMENFRARLVAQCLVDEEGQRLFTDADVEQLGQKSAAALLRVYDVAQRLSGLSQADMQELKEVFLAGPNGGSPSA